VTVLQEDDHLVIGGEAIYASEVMDVNDMEQRRRKLARHYEIVAEARMEWAGYAAPRSAMATVYHRLRRTLETQFLGTYFGEPPPWRLLLRRFAGRRILPDFGVIGSPKGGTSDLAVSLMLHPNVIPPLTKERHRVNIEDWRIVYPTERQKERHARLHGVAMSPLMFPCLHLRRLSESFAKVRPTPRVVLMLRHPVNRVYSQWKWERLLAGKSLSHLPYLATFADYVAENLDNNCAYYENSVAGYPALMSSIYWQAVRQWRKNFGAHNTLVLNVDDYFANRDLTLRRIQAFVGLPYVRIPSFNTKINENPLQLPPPDAESLTRLRDYFRPHNEKLWDVLGERWDWDDDRSSQNTCSALANRSTPRPPEGTPCCQ
jgi:hypothetical protein